MNNNRRKFSILMVLMAGITICIGIQFVGKPLTNPEATSEIEVPQAVKDVLTTSCFDCHSNNTKLSWYDKIAPMSWLVNDDVLTARSRFNFSEWDKLPHAEQAAKLWEILAFAEAGRMPLRQYSLLHPEAKLTNEKISILREYVTALSINSVDDSSKIALANKQYAEWNGSDVTLEEVPTALNGIGYIKEYKNWQVMSTTSRFDNGTIRIIYGNPVAIQALKDRNINPWPDGATIVKVVWDKLEDKDGNVRAGKFNNVQYMIRDGKRFPSTEGWGFARFDTQQLVPYGKDATFGTTCINCHQVVKQNGFVFNISVKE